MKYKGPEDRFFTYRGHVSLGEGGTCAFIVTGLSSDSSALLTLAVVGGTREYRWDCHTPDKR